MWSRDELARLRTRAMREGIWFRLLSRTERAIIDITIRSVEFPRGDKLIGTLNLIVSRIMKGLKPSPRELAKTIGIRLATRIAELASSWGHHDAHNWKRDIGFATYLAVLYLNTPSYFQGTMEDEMLLD